MAAVLDICNMALGHLGDQASISDLDPPDGSEQADHCARWYPIALGSLLERHQWGFCTRLESLAEVAGEAVGPWRYAYALPADLVTVKGVFRAGDDNESDPKPFVLQKGATDTVLLTNEQAPLVRFTVDGTDSSRFPYQFTLALSRLLASMIAGPLLRGATGRAEAEKQRQLAEGEFRLAADADANQQRNIPEHRVPWHDGRAQPPNVGGSFWTSTLAAE